MKRFDSSRSFRLLDLWRRAQNILVVTAVTALIWLYAERESIQRGEITARLQLVPPPGQSLIIRPDEIEVQVGYRCSTSEQQRLRDVLSQPVQIEVEADPAEREQTISLRDRLVRNSPIARLAVDVERLTPEAVPVTVLRLTTLRLPIEVQSAQYELAAPPTIEPEEAEVQLPLVSAPLAENKHLEVRLGDVDRPLAPGQTYNLRLPLVPPDALPPPVRMTPSSVDVTFTIASQTQALTLKSVRIMVSAPWKLLADYAVELPNDLLVLPEPVDVTGPSDKIQKLAEDPDQVVAVLRLSAEDFARGITSKVVDLSLPDGVSTVKPAPRLDFKIVPRQPPAATATPSVTPPTPDPSVRPSP